MTLEQLIADAKAAVARNDLATAERLTGQARAIRDTMPPPADSHIRQLANNGLQALELNDTNSAGYYVERIKSAQAGEKTVNLSVLKTLARWYCAAVDVAVRSIEGDALAELDGETIILDPTLFTDGRKQHLAQEFLTQIGHIVLEHKLSSKSSDIAWWRQQAWRSEIAARSLWLAGENARKAKGWAQAEMGAFTNRLLSLYGTGNLYRAITEN